MLYASFHWIGSIQLIASFFSSFCVNPSFVSLKPYKFCKGSDIIVTETWSERALASWCTLFPKPLQTTLLASTTILYFFSFLIKITEYSKIDLTLWLIIEQSTLHCFITKKKQKGQCYMHFFRRKRGKKPMSYALFQTKMNSTKADWRSYLTGIRLFPEYTILNISSTAATPFLKEKMFFLFNFKVSSPSLV